ncbi:AraC family transcriptional regulator [Ferruginibacter sp. HRS2-29]|uniref:helix-turn-helix domain-containing protein n=1 Tax=Ferruginibacter sp. HRS2-29 TaxID=2487334 RepID=UPI0020CE3871|nr:helix-turn-helix domain-containing protein [Ferruginibacter sp. HRS2-29]MCP9750391.1 helix-turn-helix domain-containing protein [Ferruginibacter sp. HRS2-29]
MKLTLLDTKTGADLLLIKNEYSYDHYSFSRDKEKKYFTIIWNRGGEKVIHIDGEETVLMPDTILPLMFNQTFRVEDGETTVAWQFNREFYCIQDHDEEVSCLGFLFCHGDKQFISLDDTMKQKLELLLDLFILELNTKDTIQREMLMVLLKRLIIDLTRIARNTYMPDSKGQDDRYNLVREFNMLVEGHFRKEHSVNFYAGLLNKSPKTLSNIFPQVNQKTPLQIIQERIVMEAKRLLYYTDKTVKEITYELGFEDPAYFATFFKRSTLLSPGEYRKNRESFV